MPVIANLILTNQLPINTYTASVVASASLVSGIPGSLISDGLGNQIQLLGVTASYSHTASVQTTWEESSSFSSQSIWATTASFSSRSFVSTSASFSSASFVATSASFSSRSISSSYSNVAGAVDVSGQGSGQYNVALLGSNAGIVSVYADSNADMVYDVSTNTLTVPFVTGTASFAATVSKFSPSQGAVTDAGALTGSVSASGFGFTTAAEFNDFVTSVTASFQQFNSLLAKLRTAGVIS